MRFVDHVPAPRAVVYQVAYFPPAEYEAAWAHDLLNATNHRDHIDYRRELEQTMRGLTDQAAPIRIAALGVPALLAYAARTGQDKTHRQTRLNYANKLYETGHDAVVGRRSATGRAGAVPARSTRSVAARPPSSPSSRPIPRDWSC